MVNKLIKLLSSSNTSVIKNQSTVYNFNKKNNVNIRPGWKNKVTLILIAYFKSLFCLISKPVFIITPDKIKIHLFYYKRAVSRKIFLKRIKEFAIRYGIIMDSNNIYKDTWIKSLNLKLEKAFNSKEGRFLFLAQYRLNDLAILLSKLLQKNVELELVRLKYPYHDSNILAQLIGINGRKLTYGRIKKVLFNKATISAKSVEGATPAAEHNNNMDIEGISSNPLSIKERTSRLTGLKIRIAGRLNRQRVVPKRTVKTAYKGGISKTENNLVDTATYTSKNKKGAVSVRVWLSHRINDDI